MIFVNGFIDDYLTGNPIILEIEMPDGSKTEQKIRGAKGKYTTQILLEPEFPIGEYILKVRYGGQIVDAIAFTVVR